MDKQEFIALVDGSAYLNIKAIHEVTVLSDFTRQADPREIFLIGNGDCTKAKRNWNDLIVHFLNNFGIRTVKDEEDYDSFDFKPIQSQTVTIMDFLLVLLKKRYLLVQELPIKDGEFLIDVLHEIILFCAANEDNHRWTNKVILDGVSDLEQLLCEIFETNSFKSLIIYNATCRLNDSVCLCTLSKSLEILNQKVSKNNWTIDPSLKHCFKWCLFNVPNAHISEHLNAFLPISLQMIDDSRSEYKVIGIQCLSHIIDKSSSAELGWYSRIDVIYNALFHQMYIHELAVVEILYPCLFSILSIIERSPKDTKLPRRWCRYDDVFVQLLQNMLFENKIVIRRFYAYILPTFIDAMGIGSVKHTQSLIQVMADYLAQYDGPEEISRICIMKALQRFIHQCWPCIHLHTSVLIKSLLRFVYDIAKDITTTNDETKDKMIKKVTDCLVLLDNATTGGVRKLLSDLKGEKLDKTCQTVIDALFVEPC